ncbi:hypothetical protein HELRODRAFT_65381 [Helobdella robusta]|uniref:Phosphoinositide phospholipase C n=1 Tax=Helobdella robusta TaxID=6412 RepID=T1FY69_HELRO|nr:hypothetical protein HELRODRAFT_65381 [Helobdella robusta]ESO02184.1 hypothetical protein HELRODRAFT_65381 [Helobdella robusta]
MVGVVTTALPALPTTATTTNNNNFLLPDNSSSAVDGSLPRKSSLMKQGSGRRSEKKKTVSFSYPSAITDRTVASAPDCLCYMQNGSELIKIRSNGRQYRRLYLLSSDYQELVWHPSSKKPNKAKLLVSQIKEVRCGRNTEILRNLKESELPNVNEGCMFSIIIGDSFDSLDLVAASVDEAKIWITGLTCLITGKFKPCYYQKMKQVIPSTCQWLEGIFEDADTSGHGQLDGEEVVQLMKKINKNLSTSQIKHLLKEVKQSKDDDDFKLSQKEFVDVFKKFSTRPDIHFLFIRYAKEIDYMTCEELMLFVESEQGVADMTREKCVELIMKYEPSEDGRLNSYIGIDGFTAYLSSEECFIFNPMQTHVCQDMNQPLSHYFVASSHNTYLLKDQLLSKPSLDGYIYVLKKGCRLVKVDCWDGPDNEPVVHRGNFMTANLTFQSVIRAIDLHAFHSSDFPVIINLVVHCGLPQQHVMASILKDVFKKKLLVPSSTSSSHHLPSPTVLKHRILILSQKLSSGGDDDDDNNDDVDDDEDEDVDGKYYEHDGDDDDNDDNLCKELASLVYLSKSSRKFKKYFDDSLISSPTTALKLANTHHEELIQMNKTCLSLVFPNKMRLDSSNYHPQDLWNCGCQFVTLNYQTCGVMMDLNDGLFSQNGSCGYVLKPMIMREKIGSFKANSKGVIPGVSPQILHIKIISAQNLPKPEGAASKSMTLDPYVTIEIIGIPADCMERRTRTIQHMETSTATVGPIYDESFEFELNLMEMAMVRFAVLDDEFIGDEFIGQHTIPACCLLPGYRNLPLKSSSGDCIKDCLLFVHIVIDNKKEKSKASRRGSLLSKKRFADEDFIQLKLTGLKAVDDVFRSSSLSRKEACELSSRVHSSFVMLRELCGLAPICNIKQTVRQLFVRVQNLGESVSLEVNVVDGCPMLNVTGVVPDVIKKTLAVFEMFVMDNKNLEEKANKIIDKLSSCRSSAMTYHDNLSNMAASNGFKGKKLNKTLENYAWNIRVLKGQEDLMRQARIKSMEHLKQVQLD